MGPGGWGDNGKVWTVLYLDQMAPLPPRNILVRALESAIASRYYYRCYYCIVGCWCLSWLLGLTKLSVNGRGFNLAVS
jgi:hypothetical protein